ncbi:MAG: cob(I)yrinic acid a,c-diamide adenosyltransferase [Candidatus Cloacimonetes bacterium]|nr:cob(I)yrinic acid a,c-diamide adenosyltransferase [Candidatus Cloacimonadota bacterium]
MLIYTKTGDKGSTSLAGGQRIKKNNLRIESYGTSDELNSFIGLAISFGTDTLTTSYLTQIQNQIFDLGADLSILPEDQVKFKLQKFDDSYTKSLEDMIDTITDKLDPLKEFILPGGAQTSSYLHACRTICRRAERQVITLAEAETNINPNCIKYLNRLSDLLFVLARYENHVKNIPEPKWRQTKVS